MYVSRTGTVGPGHPDYLIIRRIEAEILKRAGGMDRLRVDFPRMIRRAIDEIIDTPRSKRLRLSQLQNTEKTYLGTKIEIFLRDYLDVPKGLLDLLIDGLDVDVKNTVGRTWMIPREALGKPCILIASDEKRAICQLGIFVARPANLTVGQNQDKKNSVSAAAFSNIHWLLLNEPYPPNFWEHVNSKVAQHIMEGGSGNERLVRLFKAFPERPIHRDIIQGVARQKDYMKRLRKNGGARDTLAREGIALLSGTYNAGTVAHLGLGQIKPDEFIAFKATTPQDIVYLKGAGLI